MSWKTSIVRRNMFIWAIETGFSIAPDIIVQDSDKKNFKLREKNFSIFLDLGGGSRVGKALSSQRESRS